MVGYSMQWVFSANSMKQKSEKKKRAHCVQFQDFEMANVNAFEHAQKKKEMKEENIVDALTAECGFRLIIEADGKFMYKFSSFVVDFECGIQIKE